MQSDLSNASNLLKLDQVSSGDFPTSLTLANGGKGIIPNPSLDDYKYTVDNTSNPKNFCLQYREGTNTYAIDNDSAVSKGVCLTNLVTNGDFRNGTTGWVISSNATITGSQIIFTANSVNMYFLQSNLYTPNSKSGNKLYIKLNIVSNTLVGTGYIRVGGYGGNDFCNQNDISSVNTSIPIGNISKIITVREAAGNDNQSTIFLLATYTSGSMIIDDVEIIDLTTAFGAGNEPTQAQMDTIISNYPNSWFNIVAKANL